MREMILPLKRTVFLPKGSPGICSVREIHADVRHYEVAAEGGRVFCSGEADLLIEYLSFAAGKQYPGYECYEQQLGNGGSMWQALLTVPFELAGAGDLPCPPLAELAVGRMNWFMVSPHALEMEIELCLSWQEAAAEPVAEAPVAAKREPVGWRQITLADMERENARLHTLNTSVGKIKEECLNMEHDDKIMRLGVSDQGWQIITHMNEAEQPAAEAVIPEPVIPEAVIPEPVIAEPAGTETSILAAAIEEVAVKEVAVKEVVAEEVVVAEVAVEEVVVKEVVAEEMVAEEVVAEEVVAEEVVAEEIVVEKAVLEEIVVEEIVAEEVTVAEVVTEEIVAEEPLVLVAAPLLNIQTTETPWQPPCEPETVVEAPTTPMQLDRSATRSRAVGLPRLHVRHEQMRRASYQVNFQIDDNPPQK